MYFFILLIIILLILVFFYKNKEFFQNYKLNEYVPYYQDKIININKNSYLFENDKEWFISKLESFKNKDIKDSILLNEINYDSDKIGIYLVKDILKNNFKIIETKTLKANNSIWAGGLCDIVLSNHVIHRDNKLYGIILDLYTLIDKKTDKIYLLDYKFLGYITEDQLNENKSYDDNYVCNYLKKIKEDRGITPSQNEFCKDL